MTSSLPPIQIHVLTPDGDDEVALTDVGVVNINGERHLFLSPQSFGSAVRQVSSAMPDLPREQVERLVREHCSEFKELDELLGSVEPTLSVEVPSLPEEPPQTVRSGGRAKRWAIVAALLPALVGSWALGHFTGRDTAGTAVSAPGTSLAPGQGPGMLNSAVQPFIGPEFMDFSEAGQIDCQPIDNLQAECTDSDGMVMSTKAATGPDSTIFTFSYGSEQLGLRIFGDADYAETWTQQDGSKELYPNMARSGRYVLWGTDEGRLNEYVKLVRSAPPKSPGTRALSGALPPRLAALTLGTLGLDETDVHTILFTPQDAPLDAPVLMAAQAVLGLNVAVPPSAGVGEDDIVAIAAGIEPQPVVNVPDQGAHPSDVVPAKDAAGSGAPSGGSSRPPSEGKPTEDAQTPTPEEPEVVEPVPPPLEQGPAQSQPPSPPIDPVPPVTEAPVPPQDSGSGTDEPIDPVPPVTEAPVPPQDSGSGTDEPIDPVPPVTETPVPPQDSGSAQPSPPTGDNGSAAEEPPVDDGVNQGDDAGQLPTVP